MLDFNEPAIRALGPEETGDFFRAYLNSGAAMAVQRVNPDKQDAPVPQAPSDNSQPG